MGKCAYCQTKMIPYFNPPQYLSGALHRTNFPAGHFVRTKRSEMGGGQAQPMVPNVPVTGQVEVVVLDKVHRAWHICGGLHFLAKC